MPNSNASSIGDDISNTTLTPEDLIEEQSGVDQTTWPPTTICVRLAATSSSRVCPISPYYRQTFNPAHAPPKTIGLVEVGLSRCAIDTAFYRGTFAAADENSVVNLLTIFGRQRTPHDNNLSKVTRCFYCSSDSKLETKETLLQPPSDDGNLSGYL